LIAKKSNKLRGVSVPTPILPGIQGTQHALAYTYFELNCSLLSFWPFALIDCKLFLHPGM
jgi:hypothetical protein